MTKLFALAVLSIITAPNAGFADYSTQNNPNYSNTSQQAPNQNENSQYRMSAEQSFTRGADNRFNGLRQEDRNMIRQDHEMMKEGYDPNEWSYGNGQNRNYQGQYDQGQQYGNQAQMMRGEGGYGGQAHYNNGYGAATPQSFPLGGSSQGNEGFNGSQNNAYSHEGYDIGRVNPNDHHPVYEYMLGKDGKWHQVEATNQEGQGNLQQSGSNQGQSSSYNKANARDRYGNQGNSAGYSSYK